MIVIPLIILLSVAFTIYGGMYYKHRGWKPSVWLAVASSALASFLAFALLLLAMDGMKVFSADFWTGDGKPGALDIIVPMAGFGIILGLVPAAIVVAMQQRRKAT